MKTALNLIALSSLAALVAAAAAESFGFSLPSVVTAEAALSLFVGAFVLLAFLGEYGRRPVLDLLQARPRAVRATAAGRLARMHRYRAARPLAA